MAVSELPAGFVLDQPAMPVGLPAGFVLDGPNQALDIAKGAGTGLAEGAIGMAGMPGDAAGLLNRGVDWALGKIGVQQTLPAANYDLGTSHQIQSGVEGVTGKFPQPRTTAGKIAETAGSFLPAMIGGPEGLATKVLTRVAAPTLGAEAAGVLTNDNPYAKVAGALLSPAALAGARRVITPLPATAERQALADTLRNEGVPLTAGQATGSKALQWAESTFGDMLGAGGRPTRTMENQAEQFTGAALQRAGENATRATPEVIDNAFRRIGNDFEGVAQRNNVIADPRLGNDLARVEGEYNNLVSPSNRAPVIANTIRDVGDVVAQNGGHLTGEQYNAMTSRLARQARNAKADPQLQEALQGVRSSLDDAMERSLFRSGNSADMQILRNARNQYRNLLVIEKAATGAGSNAAEGLISPSQLRNAVVQQGRRSYARGQGDFADLARAGEALLKPLPNSGTAPRLNMQHALQTIGSVVGGAAGTTAGPGGTLAGAMAGLGAPALAGRVLMSRPVQAYLGNQVLHPGPQQSRVEDFKRLMLASAAARRQMLPAQ